MYVFYEAHNIIFHRYRYIKLNILKQKPLINSFEIKIIDFFA